MILYIRCLAAAFIILWTGATLAIWRPRVEARFPWLARHWNYSIIPLALAMAVVAGIFGR